MKLVYSLFLICFLLACQSTPKEEQNKTIPAKNTGTLQMIDSIKSIISKTNFRNHIYESSQKANLLELEVKNAINTNTLSPQLYLDYAKTLLNAGKTTEAKRIFDDILDKLPQNKAINQQTKNLHEAIAITYLRLGEQQNCIDNHSDESCLFPIKGKGIHLDKTGSTAAIEKYKEILKVFPDDLRSRWLLNLAYMTIGTYPDQVPKKFLMKPDLFQSEYPMDQFKNISSNVGVAMNDLAGGVILDDFNNDSWVDIVSSSWSMFGQVRVYINDKNGGFTDQTENNGLKGLVGGLNLIQADYNNDGFLDFYIIRGAWRGLEWMGQLPNSLIRNNGDGTFSDVTIEAGLFDPYPSQSAVWLDFNTDGHLDLFVGNETQTPKEVHPCQLFLNKGDGTFKDVAPTLNLNIEEYVKGVACGDINNDDLPDIYVSIITGANKLFINKGGSSIEDWQFEEAAKTWAVEEPLESFPTWFFDYNNDGWEDIFVTSFDKFSLFQQSREIAADYLGIKSNSDWPRLYLNEKGKQFKDVTASTGLQRILPTMGCNFGDLDNDGWIDFYLGTGAPDYRDVVPNRMFRNNAGKKFQDVTYSGNFGHIQKGHGIGFADLDKDGDQDIYAVMGGSYSGDNAHNVLFENPGSDHSWINIKLVGKRSNRSAIGANVKISVERENGTISDIYNKLSSGGSFGANSLNLEIGLGKIKSIKNLAINWPDGKWEYVDYGTVEANRFLKIEEDQSNVEYLESKPTVFKKSSGGHEHHHH